MRKEKRKEHSRADSAKKKNEKFSKAVPLETQRGILVIVLITVGALGLLSLFGWAGSFGEYYVRGLRFLFGYGEYMVPAILVIFGLLLLNPDRLPLEKVQGMALALGFTSLLGLFELFEHGGFFGKILAAPLQYASGFWASLIILFALFLIFLLLSFRVSLDDFRFGFARVKDFFRDNFLKLRGRFDVTVEEKNEEFENVEGGEDDEAEVLFSRSDLKDAPVPEASRLKPKQLSLIPDGKKTASKKNGQFPLDALEKFSGIPTSGDINLNKERIRKTLENFGIEVEMGDVSVGPTVTQYTLKPAEGVKLSQITTLQNDLALALAAHPIRIEAPIPGKSLVGIELPNKSVALVGLRGLLESEAFRKRKGNLVLSLGRDVAGEVHCVDLDPLPHLLIAGATGSGKSVCINTILLSLLYENSPDDMKLILVDPKRVELTAYNGIPHLLTPVITDTQRTINALRWTVKEMDRRYEILSQQGKRNIQMYNASGGSMPYIVVVIDELADLMSTAANEVEAAIVRLAQMARAVGIHLVLATQRPSVDVITGLIKANITARIAFSVASQVDSRTILDHSGAEKLLGKGDMLFISASLSKPKRLQGAYVTEGEMDRVLGYFKKDATAPEYVSEVIATQGFASSGGGDSWGETEDEEVLGQAKEVILQAGKASASLLQRRLKLGYARAARILDILEEQGFIGPAQGAKPREVLESAPREDSVEDEI